MSVWKGWLQFWQRQRRSWRLPVAILAISACIWLGLIGLARFIEQGPASAPKAQLQRRTAPAAPTAEKPEPIAAGVLQELCRRQLRLPPQDLDRHSIISRPYPSQAARQQLRQTLAGQYPQLQLQCSPAQGLLQIQQGQRLVLQWRFSLNRGPQQPALAIIVDDIGYADSQLQDLLHLHLPLTLAVLPALPRSAALAQKGWQQGHEILLHLPMEPREYPRIDPGPQALLTRLSPSQISQRLTRHLQEIPWAQGVNNHMGSAFTAQAPLMRLTLQRIQQQGLFFVDSLTSAQSVGAATAMQLHMPYAQRDIFLDNQRQVEAIYQQLQKLVRLARRQGQAIGTCHPYPSTIEALRRFQQELPNSGVTMVPVSSLVAGDYQS